MALASANVVLQSSSNPFTLAEASHKVCDLCRDSAAWIGFTRTYKTRWDCQTQRKSYKATRIGGWIVGWENNSDWNFKDLEEMAGNAKALKKNNEEFDGILIGPSMVPHFFARSEILSVWVFHPLA